MIIAIIMKKMVKKAGGANFTMTIEVMKMDNLAENVRTQVLDTIHKVGYDSAITLPLIEASKCQRSPTEIGNRIIQIYGMIGLSVKNVNAGKIKSWLNSFGLFDTLGKSEKAIFDAHANSKLTEKQIMEIGWSREALFVLMWVTGVVNELPFPKKETMIEPLLSRIPPQRNTREFFSEIICINNDLLAFQVDLHYCLHWIIRNGKESSFRREYRPSLDVVIERRKALEWLCSSELWDEITFDT